MEHVGVYAASESQVRSGLDDATNYTVDDTILAVGDTIHPLKLISW